MTVWGRLISSLQNFCPFCISVHRYSCEALVFVYTDTERPLILQTLHINVSTNIQLSSGYLWWLYIKYPDDDCILHGQNTTGLLQVVNFTGLLQLVNKLQPAC